MTILLSKSFYINYKFTDAIQYIFMKLFYLDNTD